MFRYLLTASANDRTNRPAEFLYAALTRESWCKREERVEATEMEGWTGR
jgi:hypothetical protein